MTDPIVTNIRHGATATFSVDRNYRIESGRRERSRALWRSASVLATSLAILAFLTIVLSKIVGDPFVAILICGLIAITVAPFVAARPAGRARR